MLSNILAGLMFQRYLCHYFLDSTNFKDSLLAEFHNFENFHCEIVGNDSNLFFFTSYRHLACMYYAHDLFFIPDSKHRLDRTKKFGILRKPDLCWIWMHAMAKILFAKLVKKRH